MTKTSTTERIFEEYELPPEFPGGSKELYKFIHQNLIYPEEAVQKEIAGRVVVKFCVNLDSTLSDFKIVRGVHPLLDSAAMKVVKLIPKMIPGKFDGIPHKFYYNMPISFRLPTITDSIAK